MPRIPDRANDSASSMWKLNDIYVAQNGGEWPPPYVPYTSQQQYIRRSSGSWGNMTDGASGFNGYPIKQPTADPYLSGTSTQYFYGNNCDAISFYVTSSYATTYKINKFGFGALGNVTSADSNNNYYYFRITETRGTGGTELYLKSYPTYNFAWFGNGSSFVNSYGVQLLSLPSTDDYGRPIPTLTVGSGTWYTAAMGWAYGGEGSMYAYQGGSWEFPSRTITTGGGTVTMNFDTSYFNGGGIWGSSNGTHNTAGQHQVFGIEI